MTETAKPKCSICNGPIEPKGTWLLGNSAEPINDGRCCDLCDQTIVIPTRIRRMRNRSEQT
jgi:hypothetical protein